MELTVYKASAGSGKTYTLASEYLRLALSKPNSKQAFRSILAVTFTNKATEEMKSRILLLLDSLAKGEQPELAKELAYKIGCTDKALQERALKLRSAILHDYSHFAILTIDRFFQQILQAFVREAGLRPGYTVELDADRLLNDAVIKVMEEAGSDKTLRAWILRLVEAGIEAGKSWDVTPQLRALGQEVFKEAYQYFSDDYRKKLADKTVLNEYLHKLQELTDEFEKAMANIGEKAIDYIASCELSVDDFKNKKSGIAGYFLKLKAGSDYAPTKRALAALGVPEEWYTKTAAKNIEVQSAYVELNKLLKEALTLWNAKGAAYNTAIVLLKNFMRLGLLSDISRHIQLLANEENLIPISNSVYLLSRLIGESDTPFIYEKTGVQYRHYMIDEFQDTSTGQWHNFRPLLHNSLSEGHASMIVGDVKQSIYRWRNGDWKILGHKLAKDFSIFGIRERELNSNWRSKGAIIRYNNELFTRLAETLQAAINTELDSVTIQLDKQSMLQAMVSTAYSNITQLFSPKTEADKGFVSLEVVTDSEEKKAAEVVLERLPLMIAELQDRGYKPSEIAILVRRGIEGQQVADTLLTYKQKSGDTTHCFDVISQDSLFIVNSSVVKLVICILRLALNSTDSISQSYVCYELANRKHSGIDENPHEALASGLSEKDAAFIASLTDASLLESFEQIIQHFKLNERTDDLPFLQELHDILLRFSSDKLSDVDSFLRWWDEKGSEKSVLAANDKQNAIKILTIHKSKGLQFKVVIVPFCSWSLVPRSGSILWLSPQIEPFNSLEHIPVEYSKALANTIFYEDYFSEKAQSYVDNLNLLYVAFTRAEEELYAIVPIPARRQEQTIGTLLEGIVQVAGSSDDVYFGELKGQCKDGKLTFGVQENCIKKESVNAEAGELNITSYPSSPLKNKLRIRYESQGFFASEDSMMTPKAYGSLMHRIFSNIATIDDASTAIDLLQDEGLIEPADRVLYEQKVAKALAFPSAAQWFSPEWELKTEAEFLLPKHKDQRQLIRRPDRVMVKGNTAQVVDYKFGVLELPAYRKQVQAYMKGLQSMGYADVKGYIWYVDTEKIIEA